MPQKKRKYTKRPGVQYGRPKGWKPKAYPDAVPALDFACLPAEVAAICGGPEE